jgi:hypothetical protein
VIWEFSCEPIEEDYWADLANLRADLANVKSALSRSVAGLLNPEEISAMRKRVEHLLRTRIYPAPSAHRRNYPWPPI